MTHKIDKVRALDNCIIEATFFNGTVKNYDMKNLYAALPQFRVFETNKVLFEEVQVDIGGYGISWNEDLDLDAEEIWEEGVEVSFVVEPDINLILSEQLTKARDIAGLTQKELSERVGIYQADISKIERGIGNPSLSTLKRLAEGMGMKLKIEFVPRDVDVLTKGIE